MLEYSQDTVNATFVNIVERLTFMFGEPTDKDDLETGKTAFTLARMSFVGDLVGTLTVAVPTDITAEIAANILGFEAEDITDKAMLDDALGEMLNVVCGHVIMDLVGKDANFKLHSPEVLPVDDAALNEMLSSDDFVGFELDDSPALLGLRLES